MTQKPPYGSPPSPPGGNYGRPASPGPQAPGQVAPQGTEPQGQWGPGAQQGQWGAGAQQGQWGAGAQHGQWGQGAQGQPWGQGAQPGAQQPGPWGQGAQPGQGAYGPGPWGQGPGGPPLPPPPSYTASGTLMLVSGILNVIASLVWIACLIWFCVGGFWTLTLVAAIFEIIAGSTLAGGRPYKNPRTMAIIGLVNSLLCLNVVGKVLNIIALVNLSRPEVDQYLRQQQG